MWLNFGAGNMSGFSNNVWKVARATLKMGSELRDFTISMDTWILVSSRAQEGANKVGVYLVAGIIELV